MTVPEKRQPPSHPNPTCVTLRGRACKSQLVNVPPPSCWPAQFSSHIPPNSACLHKTLPAPRGCFYFPRRMNLEDNLGDIIRKARKASNVTPETAAQAAGISVEALAALEQSGQPQGTISYAALASALQLSAPKLEAIAKGWTPAPKDTSRWSEFRMISTEQGGNTVNCYLVWDDVTREAALFDTGWTAEPVFKIIDEEKLQLKHLFITHTHEDHIAGMAAVRERFPKIFVHTDAKSAPPQHKNRRNDCIHLGSLRITNRETVGHAEDHVIYLIGNFPEDVPHVGIIGDTIFSGSLATGFISWDQLKSRVRSEIFSLPADTLLCPGHGPLTTVAEEKEHNPFF